jgi:polyisoprenoid-binding protein YceI
MKKFVLFFTASLLALATTAMFVQFLAHWQIASENAMVNFKLRAHNEDLIGNFKQAKGYVIFDEENLQGFKAVCDVPVKNIHTGVGERDEHLQAKEWFDAGTYPNMHFESIVAQKTANGYIAKGNLMLKGKTMPIELPFSFAATEKNTGIFKASFTIKRSDFSIGEKDDEIGDEVTIQLNIPVLRTD